VCAVAARTEHKHCLIRLKRIGDAEGRTVETQLRTEIPAIGDVIEVSADGTNVPAPRQCHGLARHFLDRTKPDMQAALRYMRIARRAGWLAFPFIEDEELRRRIVGYKPMSEEEWKQLWPSDLPNQE
jgi:hypothetical protein